MHIEINDNTPLREIQEVFSAFYPFLSLRFFSRHHKKYEGSDEMTEVDPGILIGDIKATHISGLLEMKPTSKVFEIENEFRQRFGLAVQIVYKDRDEWRQTVGMDDFTLKELNETARNSSDEFILEDYEKGFEETDERPEKLY
jgi:hypothetical protein